MYHRINTVSASIFLLLLTSSFSLAGEELLSNTQEGGNKQSTTARKEAQSAKETILKIHKKMPIVAFHDKYSIKIDLDSGVMSLENQQVKWECNLRDLDADRITIEQYTPAGPDNSPVSLVSPHCFDEKVCVKWGYKIYKDSMLKPSMKKIEFYLFRGPLGERNLDAEKQLVEALRVLIRYLREGHN